MIRNRLAIKMGERKLKMVDIVRDTGINKNTVLAVYHERIQRYDIEMLEKLCRYFNCQPGDMLYMTDDPQPEEIKELSIRTQDTNPGTPGA